jgi:RNA polymerase sigma-70 factor (ECF subfamily)
LADAFFEAWRSAAQFDPQRASAVTWLLTIVRSRALDLLRRRAAHPEGAAANESDEACTDAHDDPAEQLWQRQASTRLDTALRALTATERWLLGLAYYRECSHSQIATVTGLPLGTVKSTLMRAQVKLRTALAR